MKCRELTFITPPLNHPVRAVVAIDFSGDWYNPSVQLICADQFLVSHRGRAGSVGWPGLLDTASPGHIQVSTCCFLWGACKQKLVYTVLPRTPDRAFQSQRGPAAGSIRFEPVGCYWTALKALGAAMNTFCRGPKGRLSPWVRQFKNRSGISGQGTNNITGCQTNYQSTRIFHDCSVLGKDLFTAAAAMLPLSGGGTLLGF